ncbi:GXWXG domain-containing protein [Sinorhizobium psoraleae]|uniref:GXWXG domain-containing protein n=1 Tax=Sinorhizobium psoraleae TaxID=520838 RepID=UPI00156A379A|nr:GXWXG domain-containing protein [Sinorhizobium psoraleae]
MGSQHEALAYFDSLDAVPVTEMVGLWKGRGIATGHPLDGVLENLGWFGKRFRPDMRADALLFNTYGNLLVPIDPSPIPLHLAFRFHRLGRTSAARNLFSHLVKHLRARGPTAILRTSRFRDRTSAAMLYDRKPIIDHFRRIGPERVLGLMAVEGDDRCFFFQLDYVNDPDPSLRYDYSAARL